MIKRLENDILIEISNQLFYNFYSLPTQQSSNDNNDTIDNL